MKFKKQFSLIKISIIKTAVSYLLLVGSAIAFITDFKGNIAVYFACAIAILLVNCKELYKLLCDLFKLAKLFMKREKR